jgi:hypothetical protein
VCRLTPQFSGGALTDPARSKRMKWRACCANAPTYDRPLQLLVMRHARTLEYKKASRGSLDMFGRTIARRNVASRVSPTFSSTRADATFSVSQVAARRHNEGTENTHSATARDASVVYPLRQKRLPRRKPNSAAGPDTLQAIPAIARSSAGNAITQ